MRHVKNALYPIGAIGVLIFAFTCVPSDLTVSELLGVQHAQADTAHTPAANTTPSTLIDIQLSPGIHYLKVTVNGGGMVTSAQKIVPLTVTGDGTKPPPPTNNFGFKDDVPTWFTEVSSIPQAERDKVGAGLSVAYSTLADSIRDGSIKTAGDAASAATQARRTVYRTIGRLRDNWDPFEAKVAEKFNALGQAGKLSSTADVAKAFDELSGVLSGDGNAEFAAMGLRNRWQRFLSPELIELIIKLILQIIAGIGGS